jgi:hydroxymethylpyrimidine/phosphomethylpyrimidine kinase
MIPNALTIAGSDSSGGAGIQADLKTFAALGAYGASVITALTAQNTRAVTGVHAVPPEFVRRQIDAVFDDVRIDALKIGMVGDADVIEAVAAGLRAHAGPPVVLDPVMIAKSGDRLLAERAVGALRRELLPLATVITPNIPEAAVLLGGEEARSIEQMGEAARALHGLGARYVLLKGGHLDGERSPDVLYDGESVEVFDAPRVATPNTHGTGCTLSAAIAALIPQRPSVVAACRDAKAYVAGAIAASGALTVGSGHGPVHHFHRLWG